MNPKTFQAMKEAWLKNKEYFYTFAPCLINKFYMIEGIKL